VTVDSLDLLRRMRDGDPEAVDRLMGRHLPGLRAYVRVQAGPLLRAHEESTDIVQSVCREVLGKLDRFRYPSEAGFKQWLYTTALRKIRDRYDYYLAAKRDVRLEERAAASGSAAPGDLAHVYRTLATPSRAASAKEEIERIERAFDELPERYREVLVQARLLGLSRSEIAAARRMTENAVGVLLFRASAKLAGLLDRPAPTRPDRTDPSR
jgi:RNA polymerase sigma-70 factor (ECF subfamily)